MNDVGAFMDAIYPSRIGRLTIGALLVSASMSGVAPSRAQTSYPQSVPAPAATIPAPPGGAAGALYRNRRRIRTTAPYPQDQSAGPYPQNNPGPTAPSADAPSAADYPAQAQTAGGGGPAGDPADANLAALETSAEAPPPCRHTRTAASARRWPHLGPRLLGTQCLRVLLDPRRMDIGGLRRRRWTAGYWVYEGPVYRWRSGAGGLTSATTAASTTASAISAGVRRRLLARPALLLQPRRHAGPARQIALRLQPPRGHSQVQWAAHQLLRRPRRHAPRTRCAGTGGAARSGIHRRCAPRPTWSAIRGRTGSNT